MGDLIKVLKWEAAASRNPSSVFGCDGFDVPLEQDTPTNAITSTKDGLEVILKSAHLELSLPE